MAYQMQQYYDGDNCSGNVVLAKFLQLTADSTCNTSSLCTRAEYGYANTVCPDASFPYGISSFMTSLLSSQNFPGGAPYVILTYWNDTRCTTSPKGFLYILLNHCLSATFSNDANANSSTVILVNGIAQFRLYGDRVCQNYLKTSVDRKNTWGLETECSSGVTHRKVALPAQPTASSISPSQQYENGSEFNQGIESQSPSPDQQDVNFTIGPIGSPPNSTTTKNTVSGAVIAGITIGGVLALFLIFASIYWYCLRRRKSEPYLAKPAEIPVIDLFQHPPDYHSIPNNIDVFGQFPQRTRASFSAGVNRFDLVEVVESNENTQTYPNEQSRSAIEEKRKITAMVEARREQYASGSAIEKRKIKPEKSVEQHASGSTTREEKPAFNPTEEKRKIKPEKSMEQHASGSVTREEKLMLNPNIKYRRERRESRS